MKEFSSGKKGAAIVMHQMFLIMMLCGIYGIGYNLRRHIGGLGILSLFMVIGMVGSFVFLAYLSAVSAAGIFHPEPGYNYVHFRFPGFHV